LFFNEIDDNTVGYFGNVDLIDVAVV